MSDNIFRRPVNINVLSVGAVFGCVLGMSLVQAAMSPAAHADDPVTDMFENVQSTITMADSTLAAGAAAFDSGDLPQALNFDLTGIESLLFGPSQDLVLNSVELLTNAPLSGGTLVGELQAPPLDWADAVGQAQGLIAAAQSDFSGAAFELAAGDYSFAAGLDIYGADFLFLLAPNELIIGAAESLFGF
jgi:hypothetical protein